MESSLFLFSLSLSLKLYRMNSVQLQPIQCQPWISLKPLRPWFGTALKLTLALSSHSLAWKALTTLISHTLSPFLTCGTSFKQAVASRDYSALSGLGIIHQKNVSGPYCLTLESLNGVVGIGLES